MLVPLEKGELRLGTWPHVHLHEGDAPRLRTPRLQWLRTEQEDRGAARSVFRPAALRSGVRIIAVPAHDLIASAMLGPVQIEIGNLDMFAQKTQRKTVLSERRQGADAETGRHSHRRAFPDDAHFTHGIPQALRDSPRHAGGNPRRKDEELLPPVPADNIFLPQTGPVQPRRGAAPHRRIGGRNCR